MSQLPPTPRRRKRTEKYDTMQPQTEDTNHLRQFDDMTDDSIYPELYPEYAPVKRAPAPSPAAGRRFESTWVGDGGKSDGRNKNKHNVLWASVILFCVIVLVILGFCVQNAYAPYDTFKKKAAFIAQNTFCYYPGIYVDGIAIGGMTKEQAKAQLSYHEAYQNQFYSMQVNVNGVIYLITQDAIPLSRNTQEVLDRAYTVGRQGSSVTLGTATTPFELRYQHAVQVANAGTYYYTSVTYSKEAVRAWVDSVAEQNNREPADAMIATFDFNTKAFTFTNEVYGIKIDSDGLYQEITSRLDAKDYSSVINAQAQSIMPAVTRAELMNSFMLVSSYTTTTTNDQNRNTNINLAAQAVNGTVVMPGDTFSFNAATGERTAAKGYQSAAAIAGGTTIEEIGGGVCQVSSTLFNAAAIADLEIVYRSPHTWPSTYVDKGRDATVNWPNLDFKFKNSKTSPIFIVSYYQNKKVTVEIYGMTLGTGISVDLETVTVSTTSPPTEPIYQQNASLPVGTQQVLKKARTGYVVETYRVYKQNGTAYKRELLCTSTYKMIQEVIEFN